MIFLLDNTEPRVLYRTVKESVRIANMPQGRMGSTEGPVIVARGGDDQHIPPGAHNPRAIWSRDMMSRIAKGSVKRINYWDH